MMQIILGIPAHLINKPCREKTSLFIYLMIPSRSFSDHHLRCGGWVNFEFSKKGKTFGMGH